MTIIIDCNSDTIEIEGEGKWHNIKEPNKLIPIFEEVLNRINPSNVSLVRIDEDNRQTIAEW